MLNPSAVFDEEDTSDLEFAGAMIDDAISSLADAPADHQFSPELIRLIEQLEQISGAERLPPPDNDTFVANTCIICGRRDLPGETRPSGFKCIYHIGVPSGRKVKRAIDEFTYANKTINEHGNTVINDYELLNRLGSGSFGTVWKCKYKGSEQFFAMKELNKDRLRRAKQLQKVYQEVRIMKELQHPNICQIFGVIDDDDDGKMYIILEFLEGGQVYSIDETGHGDKGPLAPREVQRHAMSLALGLQYLHNKGIAHRDIKPENILKTIKGEIKLTDFGVSSDRSDVATETEGSPAFLPPEEYNEKEHTNARCQDVWALGVTIYAMAFGQLPFFGDYREMKRQICETEPKWPDDADPVLLDLLHQMLCKRQNDRPNISDVLAHEFFRNVRYIKGHSVDSTPVPMFTAGSKEELEAIASNAGAVTYCGFIHPAGTGGKAAGSANTCSFGFGQTVNDIGSLTTKLVESLGMGHMTSTPRTPLQEGAGAIPSTIPTVPGAGAGASAAVPSPNASTNSLQPTPPKSGRPTHHGGEGGEGGEVAGLPSTESPRLQNPDGQSLAAADDTPPREDSPAPSLPPRLPFGKSDVSIGLGKSDGSLFASPTGQAPSKHLTASHGALLSPNTAGSAISPRGGAGAPRAVLTLLDFINTEGPVIHVVQGKEFGSKYIVRLYSGRAMHLKDDDALVEKVNNAPWSRQGSTVPVPRRAKKPAAQSAQKVTAIVPEQK